MIGKALRTVAILLASLVLPGAILATELPASAAGSSMCESYGKYCLNTANFSLYTVVKEGISGRTINQVPLHGSAYGAPTYLLQFNGDTKRCVGSSNDIQRVEIKPCNGGTGIVWGRVKVKYNTYEWINVYASKHNIQGQILYLSGRGTQGSTYDMVTIGAYGWFQKFSFE